MSRRKQAKPQHVQSNGRCVEEECIDDGDRTSLETSPENVPGPFVCDRCCEEFSALLDLKHHERFCYSHPQVLVFKECRTTEPTNDYPVHCMSTNTVRELGEFVSTFEMEHDGIPQSSPGQTEDNMAFENCSRCISSNGSSHASTGEQQQAHIPLSPSALAPLLPQSGSSLPPENCSWRNTTSVTFENLQSTKVAVAQFSQQTQEDDCHIGTSMTNVSSLLEQILALQVQQIHQLQLTNQICHQVLLFSSEKVKIPESPISCDQEPSSPKSTAPLIDLCQNLSQQLAVAARTAQSLASQSGNMTELDKCISTQQQSLGSESLLFHSESIQSLRKLVTLRFQKQFSKAEFTHPGSPNAQCNDLTCTKESSLAFGKNCLVNKTSNSLHFTQSTSQLQINCSPVMNCVTSLAEPKNHKSINMTLSGPKAPSNNGFFKHRCRFCPKLFGSESALQIHVRSHTGERPYKCNICGNRFSTRGNLKVHFQRHKKCHPHIQMNPYPIPQHLDDIPTSTGIPFGMSVLPETSSTRWIDIKPCPDEMGTSSWIESLGSMKQPSLIKQEGSSFLPSSSCSRNMVHVASNVKTEMSTDSPETAQGNGMTTNCNNDEQTSLNLTFEVTTSPQEESKDHVSNDISSRCTHPNSAMAIPLSKTSDTSKSQLLLDDIDKKVSDSSECVICRRLLRCPGAPRTQVTGPYLCTLCRRAFSSKGNLRNHPAVHRATSARRVQHSCPICQKEFTDALMLQQHVRLHTDGMTYAAPPCDQNISRPTGFNGGPLKEQHNTCVSLDFSVDGGSSNFKSSSSSSLSSSVSDVSHFVDQSMTSYGLSQRNWIKEEGEQNVTEKRYPSYNLPTFGNLCPNSKPLCHFNSEVPFRTNVSLTTVKLIESCVNPSEIELFNRIKSSPISSPTLCEKGMFKNTACDICGKTFACQSALDIHYRTHTKERPFVCVTCDRRFSTKGNLKQHTLTHQLRVALPSDMFEPSPPNKTPTAGPFPRTQLFKRVGDALPHSQATSGNPREGVSPVLSWSSADASSSLWSAAPAPRAAKQHRCGTCGKTFSSSSALQIHNRTHTGEKPFACTVCLRAFTTKGNLKVHMGTHMWNCAPNRKGRRLFTNGSAVPIASSPVILPALPQNNPVSTPKLGDSVYSK